MSTRAAAALLALAALSCAGPGANRSSLSHPEAATLRGRVEDPTGAPVGQVSAVISRNGVKVVMSTDGKGGFELDGLPAGTYQVDLVHGQSRSGPHQVTLSPRQVKTETWQLRPVATADAGIHGFVIDDQTGQPLVAVTVVVTSPALQGTQAEITDENGEYWIGNLPLGTYEVTFYYGENSVKRPKVEVTRARYAEVRAKLSTDQTGEVIVISDRAPAIDTGSTKQGMTISQDYTRNIPTRGRTFSSSLGSAAGSQSDTYGTSFSGSSSLENNYVVDGINTTGWGGGRDSRPSPPVGPPPTWPPANLDLGGADELWIVAREKQPNGVSPGAAAVGRRQAGTLIAVVPGKTRREIPLPLEHTDVKARILAYVATVEVEQRYRNPYTEKIEATYVFPLPEDAAVSEFVMTIGDRRIRGIVREREEAEKIYEEARASGYTAALMTEERPNIFTQKVANIEPGKVIDIDLTYYHTLPYRDGEYMFWFPTVVGPRFNPPGTTDGVGAVARGAAGLSGQATEVSYLEPGEESGHRVSLAIDLDAGVSIESLASETHAIETQVVSPRRRRITLAQGPALPDRDFVLRYRVGGADIKSALFVHEDARGKFFTMIIHPPRLLEQLPRMPLELVFVLDCSGSMSGVPLAKAKRVIKRVLGRLDAGDTFQIVRFSDQASALGPQPVPATRDNVARALLHVDSLQSEGGTMMIEGIKAALDFPHSPHRLRLVSFLTDGYIGNEAEILGAVHQKLGASRIFSFGVGSSVNRYLLERLAAVGQGAAAFVGLDDEQSDQEVDAFYHRIQHPALAGIEVDFGGNQAVELYPGRIPDLLVGRPVVVTGRLKGELGKSVKVSGRAGGRLVSFEVPLDRDSDVRHGAVANLWARAKIADLADRATYQTDLVAIAGEIKETALAYGLLSAYTAFIAVDSSQRTAGDHGATVAVPVRVPAGVKFDTTVQQ